MEKVRDDAEVITRGLDDILYYDPVMLEEQANEYEIKIAREEGKKEKQIEIIKNMLAEDIKLSIITKVTGLSEEEIEVLLKSDN